MNRSFPQTPLKKGDGESLFILCSVQNDGKNGMINANAHLNRKGYEYHGYV